MSRFCYLSVIVALMLTKYVAAQETDSARVLSEEVIEAEALLKIKERKPEIPYHLDPFKSLDSLLILWNRVFDRKLAKHVESMCYPLSATFNPYLRRPISSGKIIRKIAIERPKKIPKGFKSWKLRILDPSGKEIKSFTGKGRPPEKFEWNGITDIGVPIEIAVPYACLLELYGKDTTSLILEHIKVSAFSWKDEDGLHFRIDAGLLFDKKLYTLTPWGKEVLEEVLNSAKEKMARAVDIKVIAEDSEFGNACARSVKRLIAEGIVLEENRVTADYRSPSSSLLYTDLVDIVIK